VRKPPDLQAILPPSGALSALLAHELNNIAVPLQGFVDLAGNDSTDTDAVRGCLAELKIGIARIAGLSQELESFAATDAPPHAVAMDICAIGFTDDMQFDCPPQTAVSTDPIVARQAIGALLRLATASRLEVSRREGGDARCASCGELLNAGKRYVGIRLRAARLPSADALKDPFAERHKLRVSRRLTIAALVIVAHCANGHLIAAESADSLTLVLPEA
jgi:hypothetical protein